MSSKGITLTGIFAKAATTVDGGWMISISVDQSEAQAILQLAQLRDMLLQCAFIPLDESEHG